MTTTYLEKTTSRFQESSDLHQKMSNPVSNSASTHAPPPTPSKMRAWQFDNVAHGLHKSMYLNTSADSPKGPPKNGEAIVRILSVSLNPADYTIVELPVVGRFSIKAPQTPGQDFCGQIVAISESSASSHSGRAGKTDLTVQPLKVGDLVIGKTPLPTQHGCLSEFQHASLQSMVPLPTGLSPDSACGAPTAGTTAYQTLKPYIHPGDKVFINGGSGGTGIYAIQIAKHLGAHVTTTCSTANVEFCTSDLGADEVIDYQKVNDSLSTTLASKGPGPTFDLAIDFVGLPHDLYTTSHRFLKPSAKFIQVGADISIPGTLNMLSRFLWPGFLGGGKRKFIFLVNALKTHELQELSDWMAAGRVRTIFDSRFAFEEADRAFERLKSKRARGKVVVNVADAEGVGLEGFRS